MTEHASIFSVMDHTQNIYGQASWSFYDYTVLILGIVLTLLLGLINYSRLHKGNLYILTIVVTLGFLSITRMTEHNYLQTDQKFFINILLALGILFLGYMLLLNMEQRRQNIRFEYPILILLAFLGILLTGENMDGLLIFLGLEIQAFSYYTLVSLKQNNIFSAEGALKYFLIGALASGLFVFGLGCLYAGVGYTNILEISELIQDKTSITLKLGGLLIVLSLLFKVGAAPFHLWVPDAYQGSPFYVLLFLISFPKIMLYYVLFTINNLLEQSMIILVTLVISAILGSIQATAQTKIKRFIAYTIIYNNAFFLGLTQVAGKAAFFALMESLFLYLIIGLTTALAFFLVKYSDNNSRLSNLRDLLSLRKTHELMAVIMSVSFFSAGGIPPFLGFFQKYLVLLILTDKYQLFLMIFLILSAILPAYYYLRITKILFFLSDAKFALFQEIERTQATLLALLFLSSLAVFY